jgi:two-component system NtrC family sensor kinase
MAAPPTISDKAKIAADGGTPSGSGETLGALGMLRILLIGTIFLPLLLGAVAADLSYRHSWEEAKISAWEAVAVATENTTKVLDTHLLVAARIADLLGTMTDAQIHTSEKQFHDRIAEQITGSPEVAAAWVIDANGHELVSARVYPVNRDLDQSNRDDFRAFAKSGAPTYIWMLRARSLDSGDFQPYFTVSLRRTAADGHFNGIVVIAVSGSYFASFYNSLLGGAERYTASVLRDDGTVLAQYPAHADAPVPPKPDPLLARAIANEAQSGIDESGTPFNGGRLVAIKRVANYPVYVTIERSKASILQDWLRSMVGYTVIGVPAAIALFALSLLALRRTRREQSALAQANEAVERHAALEVELTRAQRLEAVGLLTAGIAHDFNNMLTVVAGNIERLETTLDDADTRRQRLATAAKEGCARAAALSKRLLGFARHEPINPRSTDINEVIVNTLELPWQSANRIPYELRLKDELWRANVDPEQLATALLNLAVNARDAMMPEGGRLKVETTNVVLDNPADAEAAGVSVGEYVGIFVSDTGHGMPQEVREKAFDPFFTTKEPGKGTGLGLALVNAFATRSGGYCTIDSELGRGTTIKIYLPRYVDAERTDGDTAEHAVSRDGSYPPRLQTAKGEDRVESN